MPRGRRTYTDMHGFVIQQDEWVVCRVFQKSAGVKKYPSNNQSRAVNPYNLEIGASVIPPAMMMQQADNYQLTMGMGMGMGRNYAELAELSRVLRGGGGPSHSTNLPNIQSQINYPPGAGAGAGGFTISGLNLNLGGSGSSTQSHVMRPMQPQPPPPNPMHHHQQDSLMAAANNTCFEAESGYGHGAEIHQNAATGPSNRFLGMDHCMDLYNYWPSY